MKKNIRVKAPWPLLVSAAVWVIWAAFLPMYSIVHFVILIALSVAAGLLAAKKFKPKDFEIVMDVPSATGDKDVDDLIDRGRAMIKELRALNNRISHPGISADIDRMESMAGRIFDRVAQDNTKARQARRFMNYYLPTSIELLTTYETLSKQGVDAGNISASMQKIEGVMDTIAAAFEKQLDNLFADTAMDISADIQVMNSLIRAQGLVGPDIKNGKVAEK